MMRTSWSDLRTGPWVSSHIWPTKFSPHLLIDPSAGEAVFVFLLTEQCEHPPESLISKITFARIPPIGKVRQNAIFLPLMAETAPKCRYGDRTHCDLLSSPFEDILIQ
jgi:hypothetical protein